jgi:hypothetical protein
MKALRSGAAVMMQTEADDAAWVVKCQATTERLGLREAAAQAGASAQEVTGSDPTTRGLGPVEAVPGDAGLELPGTGRSEPRSTVTTQVTVEAAEAATSVRDAGRADVERVKEVVEAPPEPGQEAAQPKEPQPQQDRPAEPAVEAELGAGVPPPIVQSVAPAVEVPAPPQGSTPALIDLTIDDSPTDKAKQEANVETAEAADRAGTSAALGVTRPRRRPGHRILPG